MYIGNNVTPVNMTEMVGNLPKSLLHSGYISWVEIIVTVQMGLNS